MSNTGWLGLLCLPLIHYELPGPDVHFITSCSQGGTVVSCVLTQVCFSFENIPRVDLDPS